MRIRFLANDTVVETAQWQGTPALDFIRGELHLTGTKEGCREGDCGACAVLVGTRNEDRGGRRAGIRYAAIPSCLLALGELDGAHLVTIEGLPGSRERTPFASPVMRALLEENGSQCGFCTPGFVISLTSFLLEEQPLSEERAKIAIEGNLCRCTGYGAILRAASRLVTEFGALPLDSLERIAALEAACVVPASIGAYARGELLPAESANEAVRRPPFPAALNGSPPITLGGGTDFYVRNPDPEPIEPFTLLDWVQSLRGIRRETTSAETVVAVGSAVTWHEFFNDAEVRSLVPGIERFEGHLASVLIRNRATIGGNIANASPVGDMTCILIALGARVRLSGTRGCRELPLEGLFLGHKKIDLEPCEIIAEVLIAAKRPVRYFNFEKVAKRVNLDIASVNTAASFELSVDGRIARARVSAGGVAPVPLLLEKASAYFEGRDVSPETACEGARIAASEISPIGDLRGTADYRRRLLERLVVAHFAALFPDVGWEGSP